MIGSLWKTRAPTKKIPRKAGFFMKQSVIHKAITKWFSNAGEEQNDLLAVEEPLEIRLGYGSKDNRQQKSLAVTMRTPGNDFELGMGVLFNYYGE